MSGDPYKGTERNAGIRATQRPKDTTVHEQAPCTWSVDILGAYIWYMQPKRKHIIGRSAF